MTLPPPASARFRPSAAPCAIPPAEAMRPGAAGPVISEACSRRRWSTRHLSNAGRMVVRNVARHPFRAAASIVGVGFAAAILVVGFVFIDAMDSLITTQFSVAERQDVSADASSSRDRPAPATRSPACRASSRSSRSASCPRGYGRVIATGTSRITGVFPDARLRRIVDGKGRTLDLPPAGLVLSRLLADVLGVTSRRDRDHRSAGRPAAGARTARRGLVDDVLGLSAYTDIDTLHRMLARGRRAIGRRAARSTPVRRRACHAS